MNKILSVLFLCTGNSCRSQMAEAIVQAMRPDQWQAASAGTHPTGFVHPLAIKVLQEIGIDHQGRSKNASEFSERDFDLVVTVCDQAREQCPVWLSTGSKIHLGFQDPAKAQGTPAQILKTFREVRDQIKDQVLRELDRQYPLLAGKSREGK
jgi:arsenate reductase